MSKTKRTLIVSSITFLSLCLIFFMVYTIIPKPEKLKPLPKPEITSGARGELGIDKNINESTIDDYLYRSDAVYRDMRMLEDPANYESIDGDRFLSGYVDGFEVVPLPYILPVSGLPESVGDTYIGNTLFYEENGKYIANYEESMDIIKELFPKDKVIFLMCGGGGYAGITKNFLVSLGWDENKIYNVGGHWYYKGKHNIQVKKKVNGKVVYDFDKVPYHDIDFDKLTKSKNYKEPKYKVNEVKLSTNTLELEEETSFKLTAIVLPNEAENKTLKWTSTDETIAKVTEEGIVQGIKAGTTTITVESVDGKKTASCKVKVNKKTIATRVKLDDLDKEIDEMNSYDLDKVRTDFEKIVYNSDYTLKDEYSTVDEEGYKVANDAYRTEYAKYESRMESVQNKRIALMNKLIDNKKTFIILVHTKSCEVREYSILEGAAKVLTANKYSYFDVGDPTSNGDEVLYKSKIDSDKLNGGSIVIIKNGSIYASINPNVDALKSDEEVKNWLNKYVEVK